MVDRVAKILEGSPLVVTDSAAPRTAPCIGCTTPSRAVHRRTLEHLVKPVKAATIQDVQYYYCSNSHCEVVYFSNENVPVFTVEDVKVRVFAKDLGENVAVCYCFDWTRARIKNELIQTGHSTAPANIAREIEAGNCACDVRNPKGECCLGDVRSFIASMANAQRTA